MTTTSKTIPICRCPAIEHHPARSRPTTPTSTRVVASGASRPEPAPESRTRSWALVSVLVTTSTSSSPALTWTEDGTNRMSRASTAISTTVPDGWTPPAAAAPRPMLAGSAAIPATTTSARVAPAAIDWPRRPRRSAPGWAPGWAVGSGAEACVPDLGRRETTATRTSSTEVQIRATSTSMDAPTRSRLGPGSRHSTRPPLTRTRRAGAPRSATAFVARTTAGPPPKIIGTR